MKNSISGEKVHNFNLTGGETLKIEFFFGEMFILYSRNPLI